MNGSTNVQIVGIVTGLTTLVLWLLGYFFKDLMATAPAGLESAIAGVLAVLVAAFMKSDAGTKLLPGRGV